MHEIGGISFAVAASTGVRENTSTSRIPFPMTESTTAVEVPARATPAERSLAATVATLLQIPVQTTGGSATMHVTVRLGRDYQDPTQQ